ncbi:restriction endonuclease subunit S [Klebsiella pasteurii]|uniref:restriction endonuclease subunit S n=1 Tax=Klebsiella pasteurii TaxID=2587529 RepID=UPI00287C1749|nr:restriction endonuclease subunit S [Klebsiella pasteurii]MDS7874035.1 restriction endonuclease subunit S [Klebsiella pasteurii]
MSGGKLPEGWMTTHLSEICSKPQYGYTTKSNSMGDVKFLRTTDITKGTVDWSSVPYCMDAPEDVSKYQLQDRDIVISRAGSVGFSFLVQNPPSQVVFASYLIRFKPVNYFSEYYLKRFLESSDYWNQLSLMSAGNAVQNVNAQKLSTLTVPIAPIAEQKIIAEKLDTLLAQVDSTKARLEQIPQILKRFRQAVLDSAVSGNIINKDYKKKSSILSSFVSIDIGNAFKSSEFSEEGIPLLRGQNIEPGSLRWEETKRFPLEKLQKFSHLFIKENDIVLAMDRPIISTGLKLAKAKPIDIPCVLVQRVARFKEFKGLTPDYLYLLLKDLAFINYIQPNQTGSDIPHISGKQILNFSCHIPSLPEQQEIVRRVEQLFAYADTIEKQVNNALTRVNSLTQSILAKAFRGELTAQWRAENHDLISGENSAAALLEKIKAERAASGGKKNTRKKA